MKFQPIERPIDMENDAVPVFLEEEGDNLIIGVVNPSTNEKEKVLKLHNSGKIILNAKLPFFFSLNSQPSIDIDNL